jgi:hypothetical protein
LLATQDLFVKTPCLPGLDDLFGGEGTSRLAARNGNVPEARVVSHGWLRFVAPLPVDPFPARRSFPQPLSGIASAAIPNRHLGPIAKQAKPDGWRQQLPEKTCSDMLNTVTSKGKDKKRRLQPTCRPIHRQGKNQRARL